MDEVEIKEKQKEQLIGVLSNQHNTIMLLIAALQNVSKDPKDSMYMTKEITDKMAKDSVVLTELAQLTVYQL